MSWNDVTDLTNKIGYTDDSTNDGELQQVLEEAHRDAVAGVGRYFVEDKRVRIQAQGSGNLINEYDLKFASVFEVNKILLNEHEEIDESNYTVDKQNGKISFDQTFLEDHIYRGQIIRFKYQPVKFKDIELWHAVHIIKNQELVQLEDSEQDALHRNALERAKRLENQVNRRAGVGNATDGDIRRGTK